MKRTFPILIAVLSVCALGCSRQPAERKTARTTVSVFEPLFSPVVPPTVVKQQLVTNVVQPVTSDGVQLGFYFMFWIDGHLYVANYGGQFAHAVSCPCLSKAEFEKKEE